MTSAAPSDSQTPQLLTHSPNPLGAPTNDDIEAVIKMATSSRPPADRLPGPVKDTRTQLFVGNLPYRVRWQDLKDLFRRAGTVLRADVSLGPDNRSRGYGTVLLATAEDAGRAIDMLNGYCWQTRVLEVRPDRLGASVDEMAMNAAVAPPSAGYVSPGFDLTGMTGSSGGFDEFSMGMTPSSDLLSGATGMRSLFVGNLPFHIQWQDLKDLFRAAGAVTRADVALGPDGRSRGFGTVTFMTEDGAERARRMFDGYEFNGRPLKVHYDKFAQSAQTISLVGVSPQPANASLLSHSPLPQTGIAPQVHPFDVLNANSIDVQAHLDALARARSRLDLHPRTQVDPLSLDALSSIQLDALLMQPRSSSLRSTSPIPHLQSHSQPPPNLHSPTMLHTQLQSLATSTAQSLTPTPTHTLSQPHSLTSSPLPATTIAPSNTFSSLGKDLSSSNLSVDSLNLRASVMDLKLTTDPGSDTDLKLTTDSVTSRASSFSSPRPSLSAGSSQPTSFVNSTSGSQRPSLSAGSSRTDLLTESLGLGGQRPSFSSSARPSFGSTNAEKPSFGSLASERPSFSATTTERPSSISQRPSLSFTSAQRPSFGTSQRSTAFLGAPFLEDDGPTMSLSLPGVRSGPYVDETGSVGGSASRGASPPSLQGSSGVGSTWPDLTGVTSPKRVDTEAEPSSGNLQISPKNLSDKISPRGSVLAQSVISTEPPASESVWSSTQPNKETSRPKTNGAGDVDRVTAALGTLGLRRANKNQSRQVEDKKKHGLSGDQQSSSTPSGQKSSQSTTSHRHPGPISLPPPTNFALPHPVMLSPHAHPHSPIYHPGHTLSPMYHPMSSPLHHPVHVHSPLHHPGHPQYGTYPHHGAPLHYGVMTPHGLPPITPSMPPFTFLPPQTHDQVQAQAQGQNLNGHAQGKEERTGDEGDRNQGSGSEGSQNNGQNGTSPPQVPQQSYYTRPPHAPPLRMPFVPNMHPPLFSPGIPLSPGIMIPLSPGIMPPPVSMSMPSVPMSPVGVPVPMTPGVAMTPGVTMTPGAFWSHAPWINPTVGAPVHPHVDGQGGHPHPGGEGYFPPVSKPGGDMGYFPPVPNVANEILKEGSEFGMSEVLEGQANGSDGSDSESRSPSTNMSQALPSPDTSHEGLEEENTCQGTNAQPIKRTSSVQYEGGFSKRGNLLHRESDPAMTMTNHGGVSREA